MQRVAGLDVSANRIAWALAYGSRECDSHVYRRRDDESLADFVDRAADDLDEIVPEVDAICMEINLRPAIMHKGRQSPQMVKAYMRSRWVEGALLNALMLEEPLMIQKLPGGFHQIPGGYVFALQASGGKDAKKQRRRRMSILYNLQDRKISQDEIDALAIAHECAVALQTGVRSNA